MRITDYANVVAICLIASSSYAAVSNSCEPLLNEDDNKSCKGHGTFDADSLADAMLCNNKDKKTSPVAVPSAVSTGIIGVLPRPINKEEYNISVKPNYGDLKFPYEAIPSDPNAYRTYCYIRNTGYFGEDSFSFWLTNPATQAKATVMVLMQADANQPVYQELAVDITGNEDTVIRGSFNLPKVDDNLGITVIDLLLPKYGKAKIDRYGAFTYTAPATINAKIIDQFISQIDGRSDAQYKLTVNVTVNPLAGFNAVNKAFWHPWWGFWHYWNYFRSWGFWS